MLSLCLLCMIVHYIIYNSLLLVCVTQVPSREEEDPDVSCNKFVEELPILELVGKYHHIEDD